ncbi:exported hypothetical protein [Rhodospirillaceae bacterium LM-1]|nr:exported hypothetical protein [Rhodospirillaceae bacterium LM-1]
MKFSRKMAILAALAVLAMGAVWYFTRSNEETVAVDACAAEGWIHLPDRLIDGAVQTVARSDYTVLRGKLQKLAWERLAQASYYRLTDEEALSAKIDSREAGQPYFMRAVTFNPEKNDVLVGRLGQDYFVSHVGLGAAGAAKKCWPILIFLKEAPTNVYVHAKAEG